MQTQFDKDFTYFAKWQGQTITIVIDLLGGGVGDVSEWWIFYGQADYINCAGEEITHPIKDLETRKQIESEVRDDLHYSWIEAYDEYRIERAGE